MIFKQNFYLLPKVHITIICTICVVLYSSILKDPLKLTTNCWTSSSCYNRFSAVIDVMFYLNNKRDIIARSEILYPKILKPVCRLQQCKEYLE